MLCWEAAHDCQIGGKWCHRHLTAQWLEDRFGMEVHEVGFTSAAQSGASVFKMMDVSRHKRMDTVRGYIRDTELFRDHAGVGLL